MPKRRAARQFRRGVLTDAEIEALLFGAPILDVEPLAGETPKAAWERVAAWVETPAARAAYRQFKAELMRAWTEDYNGHAGARPWCWWRFELCEPMPRRWGGQVKRLMELGLMDLVEQGRFEALRMRPFEVTDSAVIVRVMMTHMRGYRTEMVEGMAGEFEFKRDWHAARGRPELAKHFQACLDGALEVLGRRPKLIVMGGEHGTKTD